MDDNEINSDDDFAVTSCTVGKGDLLLSKPLIKQEPGLPSAPTAPINIQPINIVPQTTTANVVAPRVITRPPGTSMNNYVVIQPSTAANSLGTGPRSILNLSQTQTQNLLTNSVSTSVGGNRGSQTGILVNQNGVQQLLLLSPVQGGTTVSTSGRSVPMVTSLLGNNRNRGNNITITSPASSNPAVSTTRVINPVSNIITSAASQRVINVGGTLSSQVQRRIAPITASTNSTGFSGVTTGEQDESCQALLNQQQRPIFEGKTKSSRAVVGLLFQKNPGTPKEYMCNFCSSTFTDLQAFNNHMAKHVFMCALCSFRAFTRLELIHHKKQKHKSCYGYLDGFDGVLLSSAYSWQPCTRQIITDNDLKECGLSVEPHRFVKKNELIEAGFSRATSNCTSSGPSGDRGKVYFSRLTFDEKSNSCKSHYVCTLCPFESLVESKTKDHIDKQHRKEPSKEPNKKNTPTEVVLWECFYCTFSSSSKQTAVNHIISKHPNNELKVKRVIRQPVTKVTEGVQNEEEAEGSMWSCYYCPFSDPTRGDVIGHVKREHPGKKVMITRRKPEGDSAKDTDKDRDSDDCCIVDEPRNQPMKAGVNTSSKSRRKQKLNTIIDPYESENSEPGTDTSKKSAPIPAVRSVLRTSRGDRELSPGSSEDSQYNSVGSKYDRMREKLLEKQALESGEITRLGLDTDTSSQLPNIPRLPGLPVLPEPINIMPTLPREEEEQTDKTTEPVETGTPQTELDKSPKRSKKRKRRRIVVNTNSSDEDASISDEEDEDFIPSVAKRKPVSIKQINSKKRTRTSTKENLVKSVCIVYDMITLPTHLQSVLKQLFNINAGENEVTCKQCAKRFTGDKDTIEFKMKKHITTHTEKNPWMCHLCYFRTDARHELYNHIKTHHSKVASHVFLASLLPLIGGVDVLEQDTGVHFIDAETYMKRGGFTNAHTKLINSLDAIEISGNTQEEEEDTYVYEDNTISRYEEERPLPTILGPRSKREAYLLDYSEITWHCAYCPRQSALKALIVNHMKFVHPTKPQGKPIKYTRRKSTTLSKLKDDYLSKNDVSIAKVALYRTEDMEKIALLNDVLETAGSDLHYSMDLDTPLDGYPNPLEQLVKSDDIEDGSPMATPIQRVPQKIEPKYQCLHCTYQGVRTQNMKTHIRTVHPNEKETAVTILQNEPKGQSKVLYLCFFSRCSFTSKLKEPQNVHYYQNPSHAPPGLKVVPEGEQWEQLEDEAVKETRSPVVKVPTRVASLRTRRSNINYAEPAGDPAKVVDVFPTEKKKRRSTKRSITPVPDPDEEVVDTLTNQFKTWKEMCAADLPVNCYDGQLGCYVCDFGPSKACSEFKKHYYEGHPTKIAQGIIAIDLKCRMQRKTSYIYICHVLECNESFTEPETFLAHLRSDHPHTGVVLPARCLKNKARLKRQSDLNIFPNKDGIPERQIVGNTIVVITNSANDKTQIDSGEKDNPLSQKLKISLGNKSGEVSDAESKEGETKTTVEESSAPEKVSKRAFTGFKCRSCDTYFDNVTDGKSHFFTQHVEPDDTYSKKYVILYEGTPLQKKSKMKVFVCKMKDCVYKSAEKPDLVHRIHDCAGGKNNVNYTLKKEENKAGNGEAAEMMYQCNFCTFITTKLDTVKGHVAAKHRDVLSGGTDQGFTPLATNYDKNGEPIMSVNHKDDKSGKESSRETPKEGPSESETEKTEVEDDIADDLNKAKENGVDNSSQEDDKDTIGTDDERDSVNLISDKSPRREANRKRARDDDNDSERNTDTAIENGHKKLHKSNSDRSSSTQYRSISDPPDLSSDKYEAPSLFDDSNFT